VLLGIRQAARRIAASFHHRSNAGTLDLNRAFLVALDAAEDFTVEHSVPGVGVRRPPAPSFGDLS